MTYELNETKVRHLLKVVDAGLVHGLGEPVPGKMCVEAAICYGMGLPHSDKPTCVGSSVRAFKIRLNDSRWSSNEARTNGMRKLAIAQLGSDAIDQRAFANIVTEQCIRQIVPIDPRCLFQSFGMLRIELCRRTYADAAARANARDKALNTVAEIGLQTLIELKSPGCEYLYLTEE
jgi:hypothetical protein